jgi:hypothetical protein
MANLVVFPAVAGVFLFSEIISSPNADFSAIWQPPFLGWNGVGIFNAFLSMGILFSAPAIVAQIKKIFHPKPILPISMGSAFSPVTGAAQTGMGAASQWYYMQQLIGHGDQPGPLGKIMSAVGLGGHKEH